MKNGNYEHAFSVSGLTQNYASVGPGDKSHYELYTSLSSKTASSFTLSLYYNNGPATITFLAIRYLLVEQPFPFMTVLHFSHTFGGATDDYSRIAPNGPHTISIPPTITNTINANDYLIHVINGYHVKEHVGNDKISMKSNCEITLSLTIECNVTTDLEHDYQVKYWSIDLLVVHVYAMEQQFSDIGWQMNKSFVSFYR